MNKLNQKLRALLSRAYVPYSNFPVVTILVSKNKIVGQGVNVENVAYPSSICAEQNAIWASITNDVDTIQIDEVHIMTKIEKKFIFPCGACCQVMSEHLSPSVNIILYKYTGENKTFKLNELLPYMVTNDDLFGEN